MLFLDERSLLFGPMKGGFARLDVPTGTWTIFPMGVPAPRYLCRLPGEKIAVLPTSGLPQVWVPGAEKPELVCEHTTYEIVAGLATSPDGRWAVMGAAAEPLRVFDLSSGKAIKSIPLTRNGMMAFSPDGARFIYGGCSDAKPMDAPGDRLIVCETNEFEQIGYIPGLPARETRGIAVDPSSTRVATSMSMRKRGATLCVHELSSGRELARWTDPRPELCDVIFADDYVAVADFSDACVHLFEI